MTYEELKQHAKQLQQGARDAEAAFLKDDTDSLLMSAAVDAYKKCFDANLQLAIMEQYMQYSSMDLYREIESRNVS